MKRQKNYSRPGEITGRTGANRIKAMRTFMTTNANPPQEEAKRNTENVVG